jgi:hypothetical protein
VLGLLVFVHSCPIPASIIVGYILFEVYLNLLDIVRLRLPSGAYTVDAGGLDGTAPTGLPERLRGPSSQWHRLSVRFGPRSLRLRCDGVPLWYSLERGPGGPLSAVSLKCESATPAAAVAWSAFSLEQAADEPRRPPGDKRLAAAAGRDELWLADGDQLFGTLHSLDRAGRGWRTRPS